MHFVVEKNGIMAKTKNYKIGHQKKKKLLRAQNMHCVPIKNGHFPSFLMNKNKPPQKHKFLVQKKS